ncbi:carbonic anhydrase [Clostridium cylindrosporum]|uniref:carbonic anhydrase n=1 Tax=Clostridium cylindrosporum DSM 605 TaxID=1121307 RepID=A0A0J8DDJ6_CLOCY|nr:carbonic anhydrase [Clostridium cylindrosporum]KMT22303.1 carbonic anhydrase CynT [Clostridium cylindrosporum DSM 605]
MHKKIITMVLSLGVLASLLSGCAQKVEKEVSTSNVTVKEEVYKRAQVKSAEEAQKLLVEGNKRFVSGNVLNKDFSKDNLKKLSKGQEPFAVIVSCSDSRVDAEALFDQGLGDLFVIRDAGNVMDKITLGSVEYGAEHLKTPLIVVLGHEKCGAVKAAVDKAEAPENIQAIIDKINVPLKVVQGNNVPKDKMYQEVEDANIENTVNDIKKDPVIDHLIKANKVKVVGAKYHIETGEVVFE